MEEIFGYGKNYNNYMKKIELSNTKNEEKKRIWWIWGFGKTNL